MACDWTEAMTLKLRSAIIMNVKGILGFTANTSSSLSVPLEIITLPMKNYDGPHQREKSTKVELVMRKDAMIFKDKVHDYAYMIKKKHVLFDLLAKKAVDDDHIEIHHS